MQSYTELCDGNRPHPHYCDRQEVSMALVPPTKSQWDFYIGFQIIAENKLCDKHMCMILTCYVQKDNLHR